MSEMQYVVFKINEQKYGIEFSAVSGIIENRIMSLASTYPKFVEGTINIRDSFVPVVNLRKLFNLSGQLNEAAKIIHYRKCDIELAFRVDEVNQVIQISEDEVYTAPEIIKSSMGNCISGFTKHENHMIVLLDFEKMIESDVPGLLQKAV